MAYKAGRQSDTYLERIDYDLRCICYQRGDRNVFVDNEGPYCIIIDREGEKIDFGDGQPSVQTSTIEAIWITSDCIPIKKGSVLESGQYTYKAKNSPMNNYDGWTSVQLQVTCEC